MSRLDEIKSDYKSALIKLKEALAAEPSEIVIDGTLHRFEFTFELAWKTIKDYLEYLGIVNKIGGPRENIQLAYKQGIIDDGELWIDIMLARNALSHLYNEQESRKIYSNIKEKYIYAFEKLEENFENI